MSYKIKMDAVIFDMDGLLIDSEPLWKLAEKQIMEKHGIDPSLQATLLDTTGLRVDEVVRLWINVAKNSSLDLVTIVDDINHRARELIGEHKPVLPGVKEALDLCKQHNMLIGLASASPKILIEETILSLGIKDYFDVVVSAEHMVYSKPHPEVYLETAHQLEVSPLSCVSLEDSVNGMIAAKAARMRSIVVSRVDDFNASRFGLADYHLSSLLDLESKHLV